MSDPLQLPQTLNQANLEKVEQQCQRILAEQPHHLQALHLLGLVYQQTGRTEKAVATLRQALQIKPDFSEAHYNLGKILHDQNDLDHAVQHFQQAVLLKPDFPEGHFNLANALRDQGQWLQAVLSFQEALHLRPSYAKAHNNLGNLFLRVGFVEEAVRHLQQAVAQAPRSLTFQTNLTAALKEQQKAQHLAGSEHQVSQKDKLQTSLAISLARQADTLAAQGELEKARYYFERSLAIQPAFAEVLVNLGVLLGRQEKHQEAVDRYQEALRLKPEFVEAYVNLGSSLKELGRWTEATAALEQARGLNPLLPEIYINQASVFLAKGKLPEAEHQFRQALDLKPDDMEVWSSLSITLAFQGKQEEALQVLDRALTLKPHNGKAHYQKAMLLLAQGNLEAGWREYEWRWQCKEFGKRSFAKPRWEGESLEGKTILLHAEQGLGDTLQFLRYAPWVQKRGGKVFLEVPKALLPLLQPYGSVDGLVAQGTPLPLYDVHVPLMSLPGIFGTTLASIPAGVPYLFAQPQRIEKWRQGLPKGRKVGICWQGNPQNKGDGYRSIPLQEFAPLAHVPGMHLISLQKGKGEEQLGEVGQELGIISLGKSWDEEGAFLDTAAVLTHLDLVITCDSALAHLAGAMGRPAWLALSSVPDWRWLQQRSDSPWYPTLRLFRQKKLGAWKEVFEQMAAALQNERDVS
jgi:tetratricopeptide (TPR) repeat protein